MLLVLIQIITSHSTVGCNYFIHALDTCFWHQSPHINGLVQERCNSNVLAMELQLSCTNPSIYGWISVGPLSLFTYLGPLLLTWINFKPSMDKYSHDMWILIHAGFKVWCVMCGMKLLVGQNYLSIPKLQWYSRWRLGMDKEFHPTMYWLCDYLSMAGLKLVHVNMRCLRW